MYVCMYVCTYVCICVCMMWVQFCTQIFRIMLNDRDFGKNLDIERYWPTLCIKTFMKFCPALHAFVSICIQLSTGDVQTNLSCNFECRGNRHNERDTSLRVADGFLSLFPSFIVRFGWNSVYDICWWVLLNFVIIGTEKAVLFLWALRHIYLGLYSETLWHF